MADNDGIEMEGELTDDVGGQPQSDQPQGGSQPQQQADGQQPGGQPQAGDQKTNSQGQQQVFDGKQWALKYRGQPYVPKTREELTNLAQKGFSYEQEMGRFKTERTQLQQQLDGLKKQYGLYDEFDKMLKSNPQLAEKIAATIQEMQSQGQQPGGPNVQLYSQLKSEIEELKSHNTERINLEYDRRLQESAQKLKADHPDHDWEFDDGTGTLQQQIVRFALESGISSLDHAYWAFMGPQNGTNARADALKKAAAAKQAANRAGGVQGGASPGGAPQKGGYQPGMSYNDIARRMASELKT